MNKVKNRLSYTIWTMTILFGLSLAGFYQVFAFAPTDTGLTESIRTDTVIVYQGISYSVNDSIGVAWVSTCDKKKEGSVFIRSYVKTVSNEIPVVEIGKMAFYDCMSIKSVDIPETIRSIGFGAFMNCHSLDSVIVHWMDKQELFSADEINGAFTSMDYSTLVVPQGCLDCYDISVWNGFGNMTDGYRVYSKGRFIHNGIKYSIIDKEAGKLRFDGFASRHVSGIIPSEIKLGEREYSVVALGKVSKNSGFCLPANIMIQAGINSIPDSCFYSSLDLVSIVIPSTVQTIGRGAFSNSLHLSEIIVDWTSLGSIKIADDAFLGVRSMIIRIPAGCMEVYSNTFAHLNNNIMLYDGTAFTEEKSFLVSGLKYEVIDSAWLDRKFPHPTVREEPEMVIRPVKNGNGRDESISVNQRTIGNNAESYNDMIKESLNGLLQITDSPKVVLTVSHCEGDITIPVTVKSPVSGKEYLVYVIDAHAFRGQEVTSVYVPKSIKWIGSGAFDHCLKLSSLKIDSECEVESSILQQTGIKTAGPIGSGSDFEFSWKEWIPVDVFRSDVEYIHLPDGLEEIPSRSFVYSTIKEVYIPSSVRIIGDLAFGWCRSLKDVYNYSDTPQKIGNNAFINNNKFTMHVRKGLADVYLNNEDWKNISVDIVDDL